MANKKNKSFPVDVRFSITCSGGDGAYLCVENTSSEVYEYFQKRNLDLERYSMDEDYAKEKKIPKIPVYVDSPMALAALYEYHSAIHSKSPEIREELMNQNEDPFNIGDLREAKTVEESKALNNPNEPCIIISASGMATGGRVVHHLEWMLPDPKNSILLVGYQAVGTRGQKLLSGAKFLKMYGNEVQVKAEVVQIEEFSVHGDASELIQWLKLGPEPKNTFVIHGEKNSAQSFSKLINNDLGWAAVLPTNNQPFTV